MVKQVNLFTVAKSISEPKRKKAASPSSSTRFDAANPTDQMTSEQAEICTDIGEGNAHTSIDQVGLYPNPTAASAAYLRNVVDTVAERFGARSSVRDACLLHAVTAFFNVFNDHGVKNTSHTPAGRASKVNPSSGAKQRARGTRRQVSRATSWQAEHERRMKEAADLRKHGLVMLADEARYGAKQQREIGTRFDAANPSKKAPMNFQVASFPLGVYWPCCATAWRRLRVVGSRKGYTSWQDASDAIDRAIPRDSPSCVGHFQAVPMAR